MKNKILVLLSTYNGEKYLKELLESVLKQEKVDLDILIRDDGSKDYTTNILKEYACKHHNIKYYSGKNLGYAKSFWNLLKISDKYDYYAFCDQDDIWLKEKLYSAIEKIEKVKQDIPLLYTSNVIPVDEKLKKIKYNSFKTNRVLDVYESMEKSILPGCTFVFNYKAKEIASKYDGFMESHDWALYNIVNIFGKVIFDNNSKILYRVYFGNTIGQEKCLKLLTKKVKRFFRKSKCSRSRFAIDFYNCYKQIIPTKYKKDIYSFANYKANYKAKLNFLFNKKYKGLIFKLYIIFNKI